MAESLVDNSGNKYSRAEVDAKTDRILEIIQDHVSSECQHCKGVLEAAAASNNKRKCHQIDN